MKKLLLLDEEVYYRLPLTNMINCVILTREPNNHLAIFSLIPPVFLYNRFYELISESDLFFDCADFLLENNQIRIDGNKKEILSYIQDEKLFNLINQLKKL